MSSRSWSNSYLRANAITRSSRIWPNMAAGRRCMSCDFLHLGSTKKITPKISTLAPRVRWEAGYADTARALQRAAWEDDDCDPLEGVILHEPTPDLAMG